MIVLVIPLIDIGSLNGSGVDSVVPEIVMNKMGIDVMFSTNREK
jgi:hypothetical protein